MVKTKHVTSSDVEKWAQTLSDPKTVGGEKKQAAEKLGKCLSTTPKMLSYKAGDALVAVLSTSLVDRLSGNVDPVRRHAAADALVSGVTGMTDESRARQLISCIENTHKTNQLGLGHLMVDNPASKETREQAKRALQEIKTKTQGKRKEFVVEAQARMTRHDRLADTSVKRG